MNVNRIELSAEPRTALGKKVKALRRQGFVPANIYGHRDSTAIQIGVRDADHTIRRAGKTSLVTVNVAGGEPETVLIKQWQRHPYRGDVLHIDFYRVAMTERLRVDIPLRLVGEAPALGRTGGTLFQPISTVTIESLPGDLPDVIEVDVSNLIDLDSAVHVRDLPIPDAVTLLTDGDEVVARVLPATVETGDGRRGRRGRGGRRGQGGAEALPPARRATSPSPPSLPLADNRAPRATGPGRFSLACERIPVSRGRAGGSPGPGREAGSPRRATARPSSGPGRSGSSGRRSPRGCCLSSASSITRRSMPGAMPPCGGAPYWNARSMWPKLARSAPAVAQRSNTACWTSRRWIRMLPLASS